MLILIHIMGIVLNMMAMFVFGAFGYAVARDTKGPAVVPTALFAVLFLFVSIVLQCV